MKIVSPLKLIDAKVREAFSDAAIQYDVLSSLHREIGRELTKRLVTEKPCKALLDVGSGTGWMTNRMSNVFADAKVVGLDHAPGMIKQAKEKYEGLTFVEANANKLPFKADTFDIITSNLAYQWIGNLREGFKECFDKLADEGLLCLTMFGHETFKELFQTLEEVSPRKEDQLPIVRLARWQDVRSTLNEVGFKEVSVECEQIKVRFHDMLSLIKWIKEIGANALTRDFFVGKDLLKRASEHYNHVYKDRLGVYATFEVIWVKGCK